jgi:hypothetical protein
MKRLLWLGAGLAIGALVVRAVSRKAQAFTPHGITAAARSSGRNLLDSVRGFVDDVRDGMHERERDLRAAFVDGVVLEDEDDAEPGLGEDLGGGRDEPTALGNGARGGARDRSAGNPPEGITR